MEESEAVRVQAARLGWLERAIRNGGPGRWLLGHLVVRGPVTASQLPW
jgi:hypothetical protein